MADVMTPWDSCSCVFTLDLALPYVKNWYRAVDGGANRGLWTTRLAGLFAYVHAFEPAPKNFEELKKNTRRNTNVTLHRSALWHSRSKGQIHGDRPRSHYVTEGEGTVKLERLDDALIEGPVGLIKLDLEGAEYHALMGASNIIKKTRPVVIVEHDEKKPRKRYGIEPDSAEKLLEKWGARLVGEWHVDRIYAFE